MKPAVFEFSAPETLAGVLESLEHYGEEGRILAGGQSLVPLLNLRMASFRGLVSINRCLELSYIREEDGVLHIGALTRQQEANESPVVRRLTPLFAETLPEVGNMASRNRGTFCGSLAHADPCAELPAVAVALDAEFLIVSRAGARVVTAAEFFVSELSNCMESGEMLQEVRVPVASTDAKVAFAKVSSRAHGFALVAVATQMSFDRDGKCSSARLAVVGGGATPMRLAEAEQLLVGERMTDELICEAVNRTLPTLDPPTDLHADSKYRRHVIGKLIGRTINEIVGREMS
jgi:CO/xanthine dehydrogenase FAD-binding subunit